MSNILKDALTVLEGIKTGGTIVNDVIDIIDTDEAKGIQLDIKKSVLAGEKKFLEEHDFEGLTERENELLDEAIVKLTKVGLMVAERKAKGL